MNGQGMRQESKPVLPLKILNQAGFLEVFAKRGQLLPVGGEVSGMLQKSSGDDLMIDIDKVLGGSSPSLGGTEGVRLTPRRRSAARSTVQVTIPCPPINIATLSNTQYHSCRWFKRGR
jgi:hypothetical protein